MTTNKKSSPFRRAAEAAQRFQPFGEIALVSPVPLTILTIISAAMGVGVALLLTFGSYTRRATADGVVMPDTGLVKVYAQKSGIVLRRAVVEGQHVARGTLLYLVSTDVQSAVERGTHAALIERTQRRKNSLLQEIENTRLLQQSERKTLETKIESLRAQLARLDDQIKSQLERVSIATAGVAHYQRLLGQDLISVEQLRQRQAELLDQRSKQFGLQRESTNVSQAITESSSELAGLALKQRNQLSQIDRGVIDADRTLIESEARRELAITAPESGVATAVIAEPGQTIDAAHPVVSIVPEGARWHVVLLVPSASAGFIHIGDAVLVRYGAYPYQKFGQYRARVTSIARTALSAEELALGSKSASPNSQPSDGTFYRVTAALEEQAITAYGRRLPLRAGMSLQADLIQERRRLYEWVLEPIYTLTGKQ